MNSTSRPWARRPRSLKVDLLQDLGRDVEQSLFGGALFLGVEETGGALRRQRLGEVAQPLLVGQPDRRAEAHRGRVREHQNGVGVPAVAVQPRCAQPRLGQSPLPQGREGLGRDVQDQAAGAVRPDLAVHDIHDRQRAVGEARVHGVVGIGVAAVVPAAPATRAIASGRRDADGRCGRARRAGAVASRWVVSCAAVAPGR